MSADRAERIISPIIYYGGKSSLAPWIVQYFPAHERYVELFAGGASVLFTKPRAKLEVINDIAGEVVNFFQVARDRPLELHRALGLTPYARDEFKAAINMPPDASPLESARCFFILSRQSFNGSAAGHPKLKGTNWKTPGDKARKTDPTCWRDAIDRRLLQIIDRLQGVAIENRDFETVIRRHDSSDTLFYADPPYLAASRSDFRHSGYLFDFSIQDMQRLAATLRNIKGRVIVSHYDCVQIRDLFPGWHIASRPTKKGFHGAGGRAGVVELLLMNFEPEVPDV